MVLIAYLLILLKEAPKPNDKLSPMYLEIVNMEIGDLAADVRKSAENPLWGAFEMSNVVQDA